jgi:hypothetical protein
MAHLPRSWDTNDPLQPLWFATYWASTSAAAMFGKQPNLKDIQLAALLGGHE